jgi:hypothetical protein
MFIPKLNAVFLALPIKWLSKAVDFVENQKRSGKPEKLKPLRHPNRDMVVVPRLP